MKPNETWVRFKAEASGMPRPLHVVEIAAQQMRGDGPEGTRFRVLPEMSSYALSKLNHQYRLAEGDLRGAALDVEAVTRLFQNWLGSRLTAAGIEGFAAEAEFSRQSPPAKCRERIEAAAKELALPLPPVPVSVRPSPAASLAEFKELVEAIMADGVMRTPEFLIRMDWLRDCPHIDLYPLDRLWEGGRQATAAEGKVTPEDQERLERALQFYFETGEAPPQPA